MRTNGWMDGLIDGWVDGWMDRWMHDRPLRIHQPPTPHIHPPTSNQPRWGRRATCGYGTLRSRGSRTCAPSSTTPSSTCSTSCPPPTTRSVYTKTPRSIGVCAHPTRPPTTQVILDEVAAEMNRVVSLFRKHCRRFSGKVSIAAHSLGGVICFDLLANQESVVEFAEVKARESSDPRRQHLKVR